MNVQLRNLKLNDAHCIMNHATEPVVRNLGKAAQKSFVLDDIHSFILKDKNVYRVKQINKAIMYENKIIGTISLMIQEDDGSKSGELVFWIGESYWGRGITQNAIKEMCQLGLSEFNLVRIFAVPIFENIRARKVLEKAGFRLEGIMRKSVCLNDQVHNACMYTLLK